MTNSGEGFIFTRRERVRFQPSLTGPSAVADSSPGAPDAGVPKGESAHSSPPTPEAVLEAIAGVPVKDLTGPVQWVSTTAED
jgi:hypothetical protein